MEIKKIIELLDGELLTKGVKTNVHIEYALACDLLSWVVGNARTGCGFITIQTSMNAIAVASLMEMGCVIIAENATVDEKVILRAKEEDIPVIRTALTAFEVCGILFAGGIKAAKKDETVC